MTNQSCRKFRFLIPLFVLGIVALLALAVYGLWNGVLTEVVNAKTITYWQALGILVLARILFGGFPGGRGSPFGPWRSRRMMERWQSLTPEQREKMREEVRRRFGDWPKPWCDSPGPEEQGPEDT